MTDEPTSDDSAAGPVKARPPVIAIAVSIAVVVGLFWLWAAWSNGDLHSAQSFDSATWIEQAPGGFDWSPSYRKSMLVDLIDNRLLEGKTSAEVEEQLGAAWVTKDDGAQVRLLYEVGVNAYALGADDNEYLCVELEDDRVVRVHTYGSF